MPYTFSVNQMLDYLREYIVLDFTAQGEVPASIPYSFTANQYQMDSSTLPLTYLTVKAFEPARQDTSVNGTKMTCKVVVHHVRQRDGTGNAEITALARLTHLAASLENDYRMSAVNTTLDIEGVLNHGFSMGQDDYQMSQIDAISQQVSVAIVSMPITLTWLEYLS